MSQQAPSDSLNPAVFSNYFEGPALDPVGDELWCYSDQPCYSTGQTIAFHVSTTASGYRLEIVRDALELEVLFTSDVLPGKRHETPPDASVIGCGWPTSYEFRIPAD